MARIPKILKMASNEIEEGSATERVAQEETDYNSVSDVSISTVKVLMRIEEVNGDPLPESLMNPKQLNVFCVQYVGGTTISYRTVEFFMRHVLAYREGSHDSSCSW